MHVDDCLIFSKDDVAMEKIINGLRKKHDLDEVEMGRDVYAYLGIEMNMAGEEGRVDSNRIN